MRLLPPAGDKSRLAAALILVIAPLFFGVLALLLGQDANWDLRNYLWYNAYAFLNGRYGFDLLPSQIPYFYNPLLDVPFYLLATHVSAQVAGFILGTFQGLNFILLFMIAYLSLIITDTRLKVAACACLAALGMLGGGGIAQIGTTFGDNITSLGVLMSVAPRYTLSYSFAARQRVKGMCPRFWLWCIAGPDDGVEVAKHYFLYWNMLCFSFCGWFLAQTMAAQFCIWARYFSGCGHRLGSLGLVS